MSYIIWAMRSTCHIGSDFSVLARIVIDIDTVGEIHFRI